jgi:hypothetical protein
MTHPDDGAAAQPEGVYEAPMITRLGTLAELTLGGSVGPDDGLGGAGDDGSL